MDKFFMYLLDPVMLAAIIVAFLAVVVFIAIAIKILKIKQLNAYKKKHAPVPQKNTPVPRSKQQTSEYTATEFEPDTYAQKHWGNLSIEERYSMLSPENKVLYAAAKKQLDASRLTNYKSKICEIYFAEEAPAARLLIYRGLIYLFLNIAPDALNQNIYGHENVSDKEGYEMLPTMIIIKDSVQIDKIPELIDMITMP